MRYQISAKLLSETFGHFRKCGKGHHECQALWTSAWRDPEIITEVVHPAHIADVGGYLVDQKWLNTFWLTLADSDRGVRVQVHTHPREAFHSQSDDAFPIIHTPGFLSLVIPNFGTGPVGFENAYLAEIVPNGRWRQIPCDRRLEIT